MMKTIIALFEKDLRLEWRQRYALNGMLLYVVSTVFICYLSFNLSHGSLQPITWNALFWIILLFTAVNAVAKSFSQEQDSRFFFYYTLANPAHIILAKIAYNAFLMLFLAFAGWAFYALVMGNPIQDTALFLGNMALGAFGFSSTLTMIAAIAAKARNSGTLMAVLGFPVMLPMELMLIKVSKNAMDGLAFSASQDELLTIGAINLIVVAVSYLLFPYLWKS